MINGMINVGKTMRFNQQQWWFLDGICVYHVVKTMPFLPAMTGNGKHTTMTLEWFIIVLTTLLNIWWNLISDTLLLIIY